MLQGRLVQPQTTKPSPPTSVIHTHTHLHALNTHTNSSPASRPLLIEMEEGCGRSKCLQMTRWEWIGSRALVMLLHLPHTEWKTDGSGGRRLGGASRQVGEERH